MLAASKMVTSRRVIDLTVQLGHQLTVLADEIGLDLQAEGEIAAMARFGNLAKLVGRLLDMQPRIGPFGMIKRETANELGLERVSQLAGFLHLLAEIFLNGT